MSKITHEKEINIWQSCHGCGDSLINGPRLECQTCPSGPDIDLCNSCHEKYIKGDLLHPPNSSLSSAREQEMDHVFVKREGKKYIESDLSTWLNISSFEENPPCFMINFVVRPIFSSGLDYIIGSCGFIVQEAGINLSLTALHVLDELIKVKKIDVNKNLKSSIALTNAIEKIDFYDVTAPNWMLHHLAHANRMLLLPEAKLYEEEPDSSNDIAAFQLDNLGQLNPGILAKNTPQVGENIWLAYIDLSRKKKLFSGVVVEVTKDVFIYRLKNSGMIFKGSSGSPILNKFGEIVAIHCGSGRYSGYEFGHGNHVENIRRHIYSSSILSKNTIQ